MVVITPTEEKHVNDWLHNLPVIWIAVVVFGVTYLIAAAIYAVVMVLATASGHAHSRPSRPVSCPRWVYSSAFSSRSLQSRSGTITIGPTRRSIARLAR